MTSDSIQTVLESLRKPLEYASRNGFARLRSLAGMEALVPAQVEKLFTLGISRDQGQALLDLFLGYDRLPDGEKRMRISKAMQLLDRMGSPGDQEQGLSAQPAPSAPKTIVTPLAKLALEAPVQYCKGIGPKRAELLAKLGIRTAGDVLNYLPWRYEDRGNLKKISRLTYGAFETVMGEVVSAEVVKTKRRGLKVFELVVTDRTGIVVGSWFNQAFMERTFRPGMHVVLSGVVKANPYRAGRAQIDNPEYEILDSDDDDGSLIHAGRIVPIYRTTAGLTVRQLRTFVKEVVDCTAASVPEALPASIVAAHRLMPAGAAYAEAHFPEQEKDLEVLNRGRSAAHRRISFEELFVLEVGLALRKRGVSIEPKGIAFGPSRTLEPQLRKALPYRLTTAQERVIAEIRKDMSSSHPMNRLVQGDVGCGKTVVALVACLMAVENGYQACLMAPTEILAEQHARNIAALAGPLGVEVLSITGSLRKKRKDAVLDAIAAGKAQIVIGTHALIEQDVRFHKLGLAIIDEQHRFGVLQRSQLTSKGYSPDVLIMTATPIPRTLALTVYGDLDVSVIDEMPPGRSPVITRLFFEGKRREAYQLIEDELAKGRQAYVVYPLVEETEKSDLKAATEMAEHLRKDIFSNRTVGLLHGRMKADEKDAVMASFKAGETRVLVSTTVIEVGVDVPNATVMAIEHPERFGLSQLHQLRGRVGRGSHQSWCILLGPRMFTDETRERLTAFTRTNDGFRIAEEDLRLRGPGEFFGTRQSGIPDLHAANLLRDGDLLEAARAEAFAIVQVDPTLAAYPVLRDLLRQRWEGKLGLALVS